MINSQSFEDANCNWNSQVTFWSTKFGPRKLFPWKNVDPDHGFDHQDPFWLINCDWAVSTCCDICSNTKKYIDSTEEILLQKCTNTFCQITQIQDKLQYLKEAEVRWRQWIRLWRWRRRSWERKARGSSRLSPGSTTTTSTALINSLFLCQGRAPWSTWYILWSSWRSSLSCLTTCGPGSRFPSTSSSSSSSGSGVDLLPRWRRKWRGKR